MNLNHITILGFFILFTSKIYTQEYFSKVIDLVEANEIGRKIEIHENRLVLLIGTVINSKNTAIVAETDTQIENIDFNILSMINPGGRNIIVNPNSYYLSGNNNSGGIDSILFMEVQFDGEIKFIKYTISEADAIGNSSLTKQDSFIFLLNQESFPDKKEALIIKYHQNGDFIWRKNFGVDQKLVAPWDIISTTDGNLIFSTTYFKQIVGQGKFASLVKINLEGDTIWNTVLDSTYFGTGTSASCIEVDANLYAIKWVKDISMDPDMFDYYRSPPSVFGINAVDGKIMWEKPLFSPRTESRITLRLKAGKDGSVFGLGYSENYRGEFGAIGWVFKLDKNGELLWERFIADNTLEDALYFLSDLVELENDDLVLFGSVDFKDGDGFFKLKSWLVKLNSDGCFYEECGELLLTNTTPDIVVTENGFKIRNNPVVEYLTLTKLSDRRIHSLEFSIYDISGNLIVKNYYSDVSGDLYINIEELSGGIYFVQLINPDSKGFLNILKFIKL